MSKTVLITGASSGLGMELARVCSSKGYRLVLLARRKEKLEVLKNELRTCFKTDIRIISADLSDPEAPRQVYQEIHKQNEKIDILINNAGIGVYGDFIRNDLDDLMRMHQVNLTALVQLTRLFLEDMAKRNEGHIINVASMGAFFPGPLMSAYFATKAYILSFSEALTVELKDTGVKISTFCPGPFKSDFQKVTFGSQRNSNNEKRLPTAEVMARHLINGLEKNKKLIIPGLRDKFIYALSCIFSRNQMAHLVYADQKKILHRF